MIIKEEIIVEHISDRIWIRTNKNSILRSVKNYSIATIDELYYKYEDFQDYIIVNNLYSKKTRIWTLNNIEELSESSFAHFCQSFPDNIIDRLYVKVKAISLAEKQRNYYCILWDHKAVALISDGIKLLDLFDFSYKYGGQTKVIQLMKSIIREYPSILYQWISYDTKRFIRFYHEIGKLVYFDDPSLNILLNCLSDSEMNEVLLKFLLKDILKKNNCSEVKRVELLFLSV